MWYAVQAFFLRGLPGLALSHRFAQCGVVLLQGLHHMLFNDDAVPWCGSAHLVGVWVPHAPALFSRYLEESTRLLWINATITTG